MSEVENKDNPVEEKNKDENVVERGGGDADALDQSSVQKASPQKGLFEQPVVVEGKRERKKVDRLTASQIVDEPRKKKEVVFVDGKGTPLGEIPYISAMIGKITADNLNILHRCLFDTGTTVNKVKHNIRKFNGFDFEKGSKDYEKRDELLNRAFWPVLRQQFLIPLGIEKRTGPKQEVVDHVLEFLLKPYDHGRKVQGKKKKKSSVKKSKNSGSKKESKPKKTKKVKSEGVQSDDQDDSGAESGSDLDAEEDSTTPKKKATPKKTEKNDEKKKKTPKKSEKSEEKKKKTPAKKATPKDGKKKEATAKKRATPKKAAEPSVELSTDTTDSDDEPLIKKSKTPPNDTELKQAIKKILDGANLEQVTMKTVCQAVYSKYPDFDLTHRKDFIKSTVRELIN